MLKLVNRVLQLLIEDAAIGHDDNRVKYLFVLRVVQICQAVCQPANGVALSAAGRVHHQIVVPRTLGARGGFQFSHCCELMVTREDNRLFPY